MQTYSQRIREKWSNENVLDSEMDFDSDLFFVLCHDYGGFGTCSSGFYGTLSFPNHLEFLGYLRFNEIPRILSYWGKTEKDERPEIIAFLENCIEKEIDSNDSEFISAVKMFNNYFSDTNPTVNYSDYGNLKEHVIKSKLFRSLLVDKHLTGWCDSDSPFSAAAKLIKDNIIEVTNEVEGLFSIVDFDNPHIKEKITNLLYLRNEINN